MRGATDWAVAVRKPAGDIHVESHDIDSIAKRHPLFAKPFLRGILVLGQSLSSRPSPVDCHESVDGRRRAAHVKTGWVRAGARDGLLRGRIVLGGRLLFAWVQRSVGGGVLTNVLEGLFRVGFSWLPRLIGKRRTSTVCSSTTERSTRPSQLSSTATHSIPSTSIDTPPSTSDAARTSWTIIVMIITIFVFTLFGTPGFWSGIAPRGSSPSRRSPALPTRHCAWELGPDPCS